MGAYVAKSGRTNEGVDDSMPQHIAVRMACFALVVFDMDPSYEEPASSHERVYIPTLAYPEGWGFRFRGQIFRVRYLFIFPVACHEGYLADVAIPKRCVIGAGPTFGGGGGMGGDKGFKGESLRRLGGFHRVSLEVAFYESVRGNHLGSVRESAQRNAGSENPRRGQDGVDELGSGPGAGRIMNEYNRASDFDAASSSESFEPTSD